MCIIFCNVYFFSVGKVGGASDRYDPKTSTTPGNASQKQTLSAFEGREAARADFLEGLEASEEEGEENGGHGHGRSHHQNGHAHHRHNHHEAAGKGKGQKTTKKQHQHASLGFESIGLEIKDGPLDWTMYVSGGGLVGSWVKVWDG